APCRAPVATDDVANQAVRSLKVTAVVEDAGSTCPSAYASATPLATVCVRPASRRSIAAAASGPGGLPKISPSTATIVSTPSTTYPSPAPDESALQSAVPST